VRSPELSKTGERVARDKSRNQERAEEEEGGRIKEERGPGKTYYGGTVTAECFSGWGWSVTKKRRKRLCAVGKGGELGGRERGVYGVGRDSGLHESARTNVIFKGKERRLGGSYMIVN